MPYEEHLENQMKIAIAWEYSNANAYVEANNDCLPSANDSDTSVLFSPTLVLMSMTSFLSSLVLFWLLII
jgi:hypothetical protein